MKHYTYDYLTKDRRKNNGDALSYYKENAHPPIVPKDVFGLVSGWSRPRTYSGSSLTMKMSCCTVTVQSG